MAGKKRASETEETPERASRSKAAKTSPTSKPKSGGGGAKGKKGGPKATLTASEFKSSALPLHVNVTHTPPSIPDDKTTPAAPADPGFIGSTALLPTSFQTGSYGWKGSKRIQIEVDNAETGKKEKVHVMLTINATVVGSKDAKDKDETAAEEEEAADEEE